MDAAKQRLLDLIGEPFDGEDVVTAVNSPTALDSLHMVFDPLVSEEFVSDMVADSSFRQERTGVEGLLPPLHLVTQRHEGPPQFLWVAGGQVDEFSQPRERNLHGSASGGQTADGRRQTGKDTIVI